MAHDTRTPAHPTSHGNKLAHWLKQLPPGVKMYLAEAYQDDAEAAFRALLRGSENICHECGSHRPNHHALRMYFEIIGAVGPAHTILVQWLGKLGVASEDELTELLNKGRKLEHMTKDVTASLEDYFEEALELLKMVLREKPEWQAKAVEAISGQRLRPRQLVAAALRDQSEGFAAPDASGPATEGPVTAPVGGAG